MKEYDKKENGRTHSNEEIASILNISINKITEVNDFITFLNKEDEEFKLKSKWHTKEDIIEAKTIRNKKKL